MERLVNIKDKTLEVAKILTSEESELIHFHINRIISLNARIYQIRHVVRIYDEIKTSLVNNSDDKLYRLIREFLSNFSSLIDYWERRINRDFGKNSEQSKSFMECTQGMYDNVFAYRFACEFRNYIEHYELPDINVSSKLDNEDKVIKSLSLSCEKLLANSFKWKKVKHDLQNIKKDIDLLRIFPMVIKSIERINDIALSFYDIEKDLKSCRAILDYEQSKKDDFELAIAEFSHDYPNNPTFTVNIR